jgi:hypothetical protein
MRCLEARLGSCCVGVFNKSFRCCIASSITAYLVVAICVVVGCSPQHRALIGDSPAAYDWTSDEAALASLQVRARQVKTLQGACEIVLTQQGRTMRLDGAVVAAFPDQMRVRAWKLGSAVFDAAMRDGSVYVYDATNQGQSGSFIARAIADLCELLGPQFVERAVIEPSPGPLRLRGSLRDGRIVTAEVDRAVLTVRRFVLGAGVEIVLRDHRTFDGTVWATTSTLTSPDGSVDVRYTDVVFNIAVPDAATAPSSRARLVP